MDFRPLHQALRDRARNFLYGYLGLREDDPANKAAIPATPDCADLPYFLRAYFAWKLALPSASATATAARTRARPSARGSSTNEDGAPGRRCPAECQGVPAPDVEPRAVGQRADGARRRGHGLLPGARSIGERCGRAIVYADPYGHVMMIVKWVEQTKEHGGAACSPSTGSPTRRSGASGFGRARSFSRTTSKSAGPGFKAFRPVARAATGELAPVANAAIGGADDPAHAPFSNEQGKLSADAFYARMGKLINPRGSSRRRVRRDARRARRAAPGARRLGRQRREVQRDNANPSYPCPTGAKIFETTGPWEDYATPSRDMRLLIAMNVLTGLPGRSCATRSSSSSAAASRRGVADELRQAARQRDPRARDQYKRSDGSTLKLTVADPDRAQDGARDRVQPQRLRRDALGRGARTPEAATCARHAPTDQQAQMADVRAWFHEARRPSR